MCAYSGHLALGHCRTGFDGAHVAINQISYCDSLILLSSRVRDISIILKQELCTGKQEGNVFFSDVNILPSHFNNLVQPM